MIGICFGCGYKATDHGDLANHYRKNHSVARGLAPLIAAQNGKCFWCERPMLVTGNRNHPLYASKEHLIPVSQEGTDSPENLRAAHHICNETRRIIPEEDYRLLMEGLLDKESPKPPRVALLLCEQQYEWLHNLTSAVAELNHRDSDDYRMAMSICGKIETSRKKLLRLKEQLEHSTKTGSP